MFVRVARKQQSREVRGANACSVNLADLVALPAREEVDVQPARRIRLDENQRIRGRGTFYDYRNSLLMMTHWSLGQVIESSGLPAGFRQHGLHLRPITIVRDADIGERIECLVRAILLSIGGLSHQER